MSVMANIVIKKNDGTTDVTYTVVSPSAGVNTPAKWKSFTVGSADSHRPELRLTSAESRDGKSTKMRATYLYPSLSTDTTTGLTTVVRNAKAFIDWDMPRDMPDVEVNEFASQLGNLLGSAAIKLAIRERMAPT